jgi:superfamily II DNA/RNA helicase
MVFCQTKRDADELAVSPSIKQDSQVLHGDIPQEKRERVLQVQCPNDKRLLFHVVNFTVQKPKM